MSFIASLDIRLLNFFGDPNEPELVPNLLELNQGDVSISSTESAHVLIVVKHTCTCTYVEVNFNILSWLLKHCA